MESRGVDWNLECFLGPVPGRVTPEAAAPADVLVHADGVEAHSVGVVHAARRAGKPLALLMDGVLEYANTFLNSRAGNGFLRPAPGDVVLAAGVHDRAILQALGNRAVATGLPRLTAFARAVERALAPHEEGYLLVATANQPAFTPGGRRRVLASLERVRETARRRGVAVRWRIASDIAAAIGVEVDREPLLASLVGARAVLTTASTLALEAMMAGRATAILHPHPWPLWLPCAWLWRGEGADGVDEDRERMLSLDGQDSAANEAAARSCEAALGGRGAMDTGDLDCLLDSLVGGDSARLGQQAGILRRCVGGEGDVRVARVIEMMGRCGVRARAEAAGTRALASARGALRVVSVIESQSSSVGGVTSWSARLERYFEEHPELGVDWRTLFIGPGRAADCEGVGSRERARECVVDPTGSVAGQVAAVVRSLESLGADVVLPNYGELAHAAAMQYRGASGGCGRVVTVAHTNDAYYRRMLAEYHGWDGAVAVSGECLEWARGIADGRAVERIDYGVPLHRARPARGDDRAALRLGYIGRVVEAQKRVSDLLTFLEELGRLGAAYEFHIVGDGDALEGWLREAERRGLPMGRIRAHGAKPRGWVQEFLRVLDVFVLTSEAEGTSIAMLEAMAAGAVPCVTRVDATIDGLLASGENGVVVPVGEMGMMAREVAGLAADRGRLSLMGEAARKTIEGSSYNIEACALRYAAFLKRVAAAAPARAARTDLGLHVPSITVIGRACSYEEQLEASLRGAGARDIARGGPTGTCDAVIIRAVDEHPGAEQIRAWRAAGLGVAVEPTLSLEAHTHITHWFEHLRLAGCRRIAVMLDPWVLPASLEWLAARRSEFLACVLHPRGRRGMSIMGVPALSALETAKTMRPDGVVLSGAYDDPLGYAMTWQLRRGGARCVVKPADSGVRDHIDAVLERADGVARSGGVLLSAIAGVIEGARFVDAARLRSGVDRAMRADMILLPGDEADFADFLALRSCRDRGVRIHSLRWLDAELSAPERFCEIVGSLGDGAAYAIYGGGLHTQRLLSLTSGIRDRPAPVQPVCIIDDRATSPGSLAGVPVVSLDDPLVQRVDAIVLSSTRFERELWQRTETLRAAGTRVFPLYGSAESLPHQNRGIAVTL